MQAVDVIRKRDGANPLVQAEAGLLGAAMLTPSVVDEVLGGVNSEHYTRTTHRIVHETICGMSNRGEPVDAVAVQSTLFAKGQLQDIGGGGAIHDLVAAAPEPPSVANARQRAVFITQQATRRQVEGIGKETAAAAQRGIDPLQVARDTMDRLSKLTPAVDPEPDPDVFDFLEAAEEDYDWVVPQLLERGDRFLLTAGEGDGKSTLLRQFGMQVAAGLHPFTLADIDPLTVVVFDFENSQNHVRRELRKLKIAVGPRLERNRLYPICRPEGINLPDPDDVAWMEGRIAADRPDLVVVGPTYKMCAGTEEKDIAPMLRVLDDLRTRHGFALMLEAHTPHGGDRPIGSSVWLRWPEFGLHLTEGGVLRPFRGARDERDWPSILTRGGAFPFTVPSDPNEERWARIVAAAKGRLTRPSIREIADETDIPQTTVHRTVKANAREWEELFEDDE